MKITIREIAKLSGVSIATVSKIINHKDDSISEQTRSRVKEVMMAYDYEPNPIAQNLVSKRTRRLGVVIPDIRNPFFTELIRGAEDRAHEDGYNLIICNTDDMAEKELSYLDILKKNVIDGIIFAASSAQSNTLDQLSKRTIPIVNVDRRSDLKNIIGKVFVDNIKGGYEATTHLIKKGCKNIAFISGAIESPSSSDRFAGYREALSHNGMCLDLELCKMGKFKSHYGYEAMRELLIKRQVDGLFCGSDLIALGAMKAIFELGFRIPEDIKIIGYDDIYVSQYLNPGLTTIRQPIYQIGYQASQTLIEHIEKNKKMAEQRLITLEVELVERSST